MTNERLAEIRHLVSLGISVRVDVAEELLYEIDKLKVALQAHRAIVADVAAFDEWDVDGLLCQFCGASRKTQGHDESCVWVRARAAVK